MRVKGEGWELGVKLRVRMSRRMPVMMKVRMERDEDEKIERLNGPMGEDGNVLFYFIIIIIILFLGGRDLEGGG